MDERAKALSRLYDEVKAQVKTLVDDADPEGLLGTGSPPDEYDDAVAELTRHVLKDDPVDQGAIERWFREGLWGCTGPCRCPRSRTREAQARSAEQTPVEVRAGQTDALRVAL